MEIPEISSWDQVGLGDLLAAFRKAKADGFFERSAYVAEQFAEYEQQLFDNLKSLLRRLRAGDVNAVFQEGQERPPSVFAKGVRFDLRVPPDYTARAHIPSLCRALHEIVDNAVRYPRGTIYLG